MTTIQNINNDNDPKQRTIILDYNYIKNEWLIFVISNNYLISINKIEKSIDLDDDNMLKTKLQQISFNWHKDIYLNNYKNSSDDFIDQFFMDLSINDIIFNPYIIISIIKKHFHGELLNYKFNLS